MVHTSSVATNTTPLPSLKSSDEDKHDQFDQESALLPTTDDRPERREASYNMMKFDATKHLSQVARENATVVTPSIAGSASGTPIKTYNMQQLGYDLVER